MKNKRYKAKGRGEERRGPQRWIRFPYNITNYMH
jgi:hypothetical protein